MRFLHNGFTSNQLPRRDHEENADISFTENEDGAKLGKLFFTIKYSFEKTALIVTVNKCSNLPAKDSANNTRLDFLPFIINDQQPGDIFLQRSLRQATASP